MPQAWQDAIFGPGRSSYARFEGMPGSITEGTRARVAAVLSPVCTNRAEEMAALDALIAQFKAADPPASQGEGSSGSQPLGKQAKKSRRGASADSSSAVADALSESTEDVLQFSKECFTALQDTLVTPCTIDACASADGSNALLPDFCCERNKSFFSRQFQPGDFLWMHTPLTMREFFLARYRVQKAKCPSIGACILLPAKYSSPFLKGMQQLTRYSRGTVLFTDTKTKQPVKACGVD
jgi:hypothetical protein